MAIKCFKDLVRYGAQESLQKEYGSYVTDTEPGYDFSLLIDLENLPPSQGMGVVFGRTRMLTAEYRRPRQSDQKSFVIEEECDGSAI